MPPNEIFDFCSTSFEEPAAMAKGDRRAGISRGADLRLGLSKKAPTFDAMTNLGKGLRSRLAEHFRFPAITLSGKQEAEETAKFFWELFDGKKIESVLISSFDRRTVCVSSQVGCPARCSFCASGKNGLVRSLSSAEIVEQVLHIDRMLFEKGERVSHVVYMGMGEPMENYDAVIKSDPAAQS